MTADPSSAIVQGREATALEETCDMTTDLIDMTSERRRLVDEPSMCDHLHETTTRYDAGAKLLTFLRVCPVCRIEEVVETLEYEPNFLPLVGVGS
jgi:hypothetical protein